MQTTATLDFDLLKLNSELALHLLVPCEHPCLQFWFFHVSVLEVYEPDRRTDRRTDRWTGKTRNVAYRRPHNNDCYSAV